MDLSFKPKVWFAIMLIAAGLICWIFQRQIFKGRIFESEDGRVRKQLAELWAQKAARETTQHGELLTERPVIRIARVINDFHGILGLELKDWIGRRNVQVANSRWYHDSTYTLGIRGEPQDLQSAIEPYLSEQVDFIVTAVVENWTTYPDFERELSGTLFIFDGTSGEQLQSIRLTTVQNHLDQQNGSAKVTKARRQVEPAEKGRQVEIPVYSQTRDPISGLDRKIPLVDQGDKKRALFHSVGSLQGVMGQSWPIGLSLWTGLILLTPWIFRKSIQQTIRSLSNTQNGKLLLLWSLYVAVSAVLLWGFWLPLLLGLLGVALAVVFACVYFGFCCRWIEVN